MFKNYWKAAFTNLLVNRIYTCISTLGLSFGLTAFIILSLFVREESRYDIYHTDADRLYRITRDIMTMDGTQLDRRLPSNSPQIGPLLLEDFPEIDQAARLLLTGNRIIEVSDKVFTDDLIGLVDKSFLELFDFQWIHGDAESALARPESVVLTESMANKYFGSTDVMGETLQLENQLQLAVSGVIKDLPNNTHMISELFASMDVAITLYGEASMNEWSNGNFYTYVRLEPGSSISTVVSGFDDFLARHMGDDAVRARLHAMNVQDIHLHWTGGDMKRTSSVSANLYYFLVGLSVLIIACCNFANLSLAASMRRLREVGIRKTLGATRLQVMLQHIGESFLTVFAATVLALVMVEILLPVFNAFIRETLVLDPFNEPQLIIFLAVLVFLVSLLSSVYPAFFLSRVQPGAILAQSNNKGGNKFFSKGLVVLQFSLAIVFVVTATVMTYQMHYLKTLEMGFSTKDLVRISNSASENVGESWPEFKRTLIQHPGVVSVTAASKAAFSNMGTGARVKVNGVDQGRTIPHVWCDEEFFSVYEFQLIAGRLFSDDGRDRVRETSNNAGGQSGGYVLSETAARLFGWTPQEAIGQVVESTLYNNVVQATVIGVVVDARFESALREIRPVIYRQPDERNYTSTMGQITIKLTDNNRQDTLRFIDNTWNQFVPKASIERRFVDEDFEVLYIIEHKLGQLFSFISALTVVIACMGLFGLASFNTESRIKEIGVRKVMGGSVWNIIVLVTSQFSRLVLLANLIAWPLAWYAMNLWLQQYVDRITLTPLIFVGSGGVALCIAWVTVGGTAAKAASQKPVLALRYE